MRFESPAPRASNNLNTDKPITLSKAQTAELFRRLAKIEALLKEASPIV